MDQRAQATERTGVGLPDTPSGGIQRGGGSVRRARERLFSQYPRATQGDSTWYPVHAQDTDQREAPQWPFLPSEDNARKRNNSPIGDRKHGIDAYPQRPPRPNDVPTSADAIRAPENISESQRGHNYDQTTTSQGQAQTNHWDQNPNSTRRDPGTPGNTGTIYSTASGGSSRPSTSSSFGSIPDFPIPSIPIPPIPPTARRGANLGPPPSSRRGASSYYSQSSHVTPIIEEQYETANHDSYASSHAIPTSWENESPGFYLAGEEEDDIIPEGEDGRESRSTDHDELTDLVKKASLGKRHRPSLTMIKNADASDRDDDHSTDTVAMGNSGSKKLKTISQAAVVSGYSNTRDHNSTNERGAVSNGPSSSATSMDNSSSGGSVGNSSVAVPTSQLRPQGEDPRVRQILGGLEMGGAIKAGTPLPLTASAMELNRGGLKVEAVKDPDSRGSLTSLPELIRRATRLASNLDRGRTASKLGMLEMLGTNDPEKRIAYSNPNRRQGSLSDMLAAFPPPGLATPTQERSGSRWPSPFGNSNNHGAHLLSSTASKSEVQPTKHRRRCCGMPVGVFVILLTLLVLAIAAAIIIPVTLIVLPRQNANNAAAAIAADLTKCQNTFLCDNGGTSIVAGNSCRCVCANGFTGAHCDKAAEAGCTTINVNSTAQSGSSFTNATLGNSIPLLLSDAQSNFSIPLNASAILSLFSATNSSCTSQNALVTFNGKSLRRDLLPHAPADIHHPLQKRAPYPASVTVEPRAPHETLSLGLAPRQAASAVIVTSNNIIYAATLGANVNIATATGTPAGVSPQPSPSSPPTNTDPTTSRQDLDFARVVVLFVLQELNMEAAVFAQQRLQEALLGDVFLSRLVLVGNGVAVEFERRTVDLGNGVVAGGKKGG